MSRKATKPPRRTRKHPPRAPSARGGPRPGAGRPEQEAAIGQWTPATGIPWDAVRAAAEVGATEAEIVRALGIPGAALDDSASLARFREEIARGGGVLRLRLRARIDARGRKTSRTSGSVNALSLQARNHLDWDKLLPSQETEPDLSTARPRLRDLVVRLAAAQSETYGRTISPLELLAREAGLPIERLAQELVDSKRKSKE